MLPRSGGSSPTIIRNSVVLPAPFGADDPDDAGLRQRERQVLDQDLVAVRLRQVLDLDDRVAEARDRAGWRSRARARCAWRRSPRPAASRRRRGAPCPSPAGRAGSRRTHSSSRASVRWRASLGLLLARQALELLLEPARVVALERDAPAAVELQDPLGDVVEEVAIVGDRDDRARVLLQEPLQPEDRLGVEVVGRLVEQQQVGVAEEQAGERDAALLAAGERRDVGVVGRAAQRVHRDVDVALQAPGVGGVDLVLERGLLRADGLVVGVGLGPLGHDGVVLVDEVLDLADAVEHVALDVLGRVELGLLAQVADGEAGREPRLTDEAVVEPGHDPQQARLAGAVRADDADLRARVERDRDVLEHGPVGRVVPGELVGRVDEFVGHASRVAGGRIRNVLTTFVLRPRICE